MKSSDDDSYILQCWKIPHSFLFLLHFKGWDQILCPCFYLCNQKLLYYTACSSLVTEESGRVPNSFVLTSCLTQPQAFWFRYAQTEIIQVNKWCYVYTHTHACAHARKHVHTHTVSCDIVKMLLIFCRLIVILGFSQQSYCTIIITCHLILNSNWKCLMCMSVMKEAWRYVCMCNTVCSQHRHANHGCGTTCTPYYQPLWGTSPVPRKISLHWLIAPK